MALYHLHGQMIQRTDGRSAVGCAAYRASDTLYDQRLAQEFDYSRKRGVEESFILGPVGMPAWLSDREKLWNAVEAAERINGQPAREFDIALPIELVRKNRRAAMQLARDWAHGMFVVRGLIVDISFHDLDGHNPHFHVMVTTRPLHLHACEFQEGSPKVFGKKDRELNDRSWMLIWRQKWAEYANAAMARHGIDARIDHRSLADQGITDREPGIHVGPNANAMWEERGIERDRWTQNATIWWCNEQPWFEENDRYVAFLDAEAAEERRLEGEARATIAQAANLRDLTDRLESAASVMLARAEERLRLASSQMDAAANRALTIQAKSERLDALALRVESAMSLAVGRASERLARAGQLLSGTAKKRWYQEFHRSGLIAGRLEAQSRAISTVIAFERNAIGQASERHAKLSNRLDAAATERLQLASGGLKAASEGLSHATTSTLSRWHERVDATHSQLVGAYARSRATMEAGAERLAKLGQRLRSTVHQMAHNRGGPMQKQALGLARARPSQLVLAWERAKRTARYLGSGMTPAMRAVAEAPLLNAAISGLIGGARRGDVLHHHAKPKAQVAPEQPLTAINSEKREAVAAAISDIADHAFLPLQKVGDRLELTRSAVVSDEAYLIIDRFDAEPEVQAFYGKKWQEMLSELRVAIQHAHEIPFTRRPGGYALNRKAVDADLYAALQAAGDAADMHDVLRAGIRDWLDRQKLEEDRKGQAAIAAAKRRAKLDALIGEIELAGPDGRPWRRDQEETVIAPFTILARAAAEGHVSICRDGTGLAMGTTKPHLRKIADMLDGTPAGRWALTRLADGGASEVAAAFPWAAFWSSAPRPSPTQQDGDEGVASGRVSSSSDRDSNGRD